MGHRLHAAKKYEVVWGPELGFNYKVEEFHDLLSSLDISYTGDAYDNDFECDVDDIKNGIDILENLDSQDKVDKETVLAMIDGLDTTLEEITKTFKSLLKNAATGDGYVHFAFF